MKITAFIILAFCLHVSATTRAQNVTLSERKAPLEKVITDIKQQTGYAFFYNADWMKQAQPVDVNVKNTSLEKVLELCFANQPFSYQVINKTIVLKLKPQPVKPAVAVPVSGKVTDTTGAPLPGATVMIVGQNRGVPVGVDGTFNITAQPGDKIMVSFIGFTPFSFTVKENMPFQNIILHAANSKLTEVAVVSTGYQTLPKERATGSFDFIDNELLNRSVSTDILSRLDGVSSGLIFNKNVNSLGNQSQITIRGRSTLFANPNPLIVVDNFPYQGDLENINPNDVESITILKDAAAASIWGVRSSNGVIVITTKKGKLNQAPKITLNSNLTIGQKPNLFYGNQWTSSSDLIDVQTYLYNQGAYNSQLTTSSHPAIPTVVELLNEAKNGQISQASATSQINALRGIDNKNDLEQYFYRVSANQQYNLNISGGGENSTYYISGGYDKNLQSLINNDYDRITLKANNTFSFFNKHLELATGVTFTKSTTDNNPLPQGGTQYNKLVGQNGNALEVPYQFRQTYIDTVGHGKLLDWADRPYDEMRIANNPTVLTDYQINTSATYKIIKGLSASVLYQYENGISNNNDYFSQQTYYTRNLINQYTNLSGSMPGYPIPMGGILQIANSQYYSNFLRGLLSYNGTFHQDHSVSFIGGAEYTNNGTESRSYNQYGYNPDLQTSSYVDGVNSYPTLFLGNRQIPLLLGNNSTTDHYLSYYANGSYTYKDRYIFSASSRIDQSNLFGVTTNLKTVPLWSLGGSWIISKEKFYNLSALPYLKIRVTDGKNGNIDKALSAFVTASTYIYNSYNELSDQIINPPNPLLKWETVSNLNLAVDFATKNNFLTGTLEFYNKNGNLLVGNSAVAPSSGVTSFTGNNASNNTKGVDLTLNFKIISTDRFQWSTTLLYNYSKDEVTKYNLAPSFAIQYMGTGSINPMVGKPVYSIFGFPYAGLDATGNPQGYLNGVVSENYAAIENSSNLSNIKYVGPATPTSFGSFRNAFNYQQFSFSFNIAYEFGYYFRRNSVNYSNLMSVGIGNSFGNPDFDLRWQNPGDEAKTTVPAMIYPDNTARDQLYQYSTALVEKGDNIRLKDIQLAYDIVPKNSRFPFSKIKVYSYINNIGILWRANKEHLDPDDYFFSSGSGTIPRSYAFGANFIFK